MNWFEQNPVQPPTGGNATSFETYTRSYYRLWGEELVSARTIPPSRRSVTGLFPSRKNGGMVPFESALERDLILVLEFRSTVASYEAQPVEINYLAATGRRVRGYPDLLIRPHVGRPVLCDVKYRQELRDSWPRLKPRLKAAMRYARERGWGYGIQTEREIRTPLLENARFLLPYANRAPDPDHETLIMGTLERLGKATIAELLQACCHYEWNRAQLIPTLWCLIGRRNIVTSLDQRITLNTIVWDPLSV